MSDLSIDDVHALYNGHMQLLPQRDQAGRAIMAYLQPWMNDCNSVDSMGTFLLAWVAYSFFSACALASYCTLPRHPTSIAAEVKLWCPPLSSS